MTAAVRFILFALGHLVAISPGVIAVWLVMGGRASRLATQADDLATAVDPEMLRIAAWSDELQPGSCEL